MINYIWGLMIIIGCVFSIISGTLFELNNVINDSLKNGITTIVNMTGTICFWSGITNIVINTSLKNKLLILLRPIINKLFPTLKNNNEITDKIGINMIFNMLGLGNAATPIGMNILEELEEQNYSQKISENAFLFILINSISIQLIPTTIMAILNSYNSEYSGKIMIPVLINSFLVFIIVIPLAKIYLKNRR